ncbi:minor structural protein GP20 [Streptomyces sp. Amel2xB2]|uniref:phage scaffolding protein n=1 Tax=Streptomyces sp. Amel2xB2 TaxID=1305829 RepID=UPI000DBAB835|nr:phage scaffolding protein [Streptomyces sp. Amel2xB2]RAJ70274.1 minor structural protein GP20 [Streptomyces sp. Amel2xB2]
MNNNTDLTEPQPTPRRTLSLPPATVLGYVGDRPVYNIAGGADDDSGFDVDDGHNNGEGGDDEGEDSDSGSENDGDGGDGKAEAEKPKPKPPATKPKPAAKDDDSGSSGDGADEYTPPSAAEWKRTQAALKKANEDGKRHRLRNRELEEAARSTESDAEKAVREAREEGEARFRKPLVRAAARAALAQAGLNGDTDRVLKLVDLDGLSVDDDGDVIGLDAEVNKLKDEYPEFFQVPAKPKPKVRPTAADRQPAKEKPKSSAEQHAQKILNRFAS